VAEPPGSRFRAALLAVLLAWPLALLAWVLLTLHIQLSLLTLSILALVPVPRVRRAVSEILLKAAGVLGDSHVLLSYEAQRSAIVSRLRDALGWLTDKADWVAIVAHSQGNAVLYDLLRDPPPRSPHLLFTFGAGVAKLEQLRLAQEIYPKSLNAIGWVVPLAALAVIIAFRVHTWPQYLVPWTLGFSAFICVLFGFGCTAVTRDKLQGRQTTGAGLQGLLPCRWVDR
jgi:hypothetical protein